jgi:hypothetical protein
MFESEVPYLVDLLREQLSTRSIMSMSITSLPRRWQAADGSGSVIYASRRSGEETLKEVLGDE